MDKQDKIPKINKKKISKIAKAIADKKVSQQSINQIVSAAQTPTLVGDKMDEHLFIKEINLKKNIKTGDWEIVHVGSNKGKFQLSFEQNQKISKKLMHILVTHLRTTFEDDIKQFLNEENNA